MYYCTIKKQVHKRCVVFNTEAIGKVQLNYHFIKTEIGIDIVLVCDISYHTYYFSTNV